MIRQEVPTPVAGATVAMGPQTTPTLPDGRFWLRDLAPGPQTVTIDATRTDPGLAILTVLATVQADTIGDIGTLQLTGGTRSTRDPTTRPATRLLQWWPPTSTGTTASTS